MREIIRTTDADLSVFLTPQAKQAARYGASLAGRSKWQLPHEHARLWVIVQPLSERPLREFLRNTHISHPDMGGQKRGIPIRIRGYYRKRHARSGSLQHTDSRG